MNVEHSTMNPPEASEPPPAALPAPFSAALGSLEAAARAIGRKHKLERPGGAWVCWACSGPLEPFHVALHCDWCLDQHRQRERASEARRARMTPEDWRWSAIVEKLQESSVNRDAAVKLLEHAKNLPSASAQRLYEVDSVFDKRFGTSSAQKPWDHDSDDWRDR